jgi:serine/threonine protein kinase
MTGYLEQVGDIVGDYRLVRRLGGGGFGNVYLAEHIRENRRVALKILQIRLTQRQELRTFINEARTMRLKHPYIMPLLDFGLSSNDTPFLVMEYAHRGTVRQRHPKGSRVPLSFAVLYAYQMASALEYAHQANLVHRDVKPENMLLRSDKVLQLSDFGIATTVHSAYTISANRGVGGTILYMAPEQLEGKPCKESDQYALAVVVYEWLTGRCPFVGTVTEVAMQHVTKSPPSLVEQVPGVPQEVEEVLFKALAKDPTDRFTSMKAFATALHEASQLPTMYQPKVLVTGTLPLQESFTTKPPALAGSPTITPAQVVERPPVHLATSLLQTSFTTKPPVPMGFQTVPSTQAVKQPPLRSHGFSNSYRALLLGLVLLLIGGGSYTYLTAGHAAEPRPPAAPTAGTNIGVISRGAVTPPVSPISTTSIVKPTPTARVKSTVVAVFPSPTSARVSVSPTPTTTRVRPTAIATSTRPSPTAVSISPTPTTASGNPDIMATPATASNPYGGTLVLNDPLVDNSQGNNWDQNMDGNGGMCQFANGSYLVQENFASPLHFNCFETTNANFSNFAYQVKMTIFSGEFGGILFRGNKSNNQFYHVNVYSNGAYEVFVQADSTHDYALKTGIATPFYTGYNQSNLIAVVVRGNTLDFYINQQLVDSVTDGTYSQGMIGMLAGCDNNNCPTKVVYNDAKVWQL